MNDSERPSFLHDVGIANSIGVSKQGYGIVHSPSRWSEAVFEPHRPFVYYPFYLGTLSALLKKETALKIKMVDGCLEKLNAREYLEKILALRPAFLFLESASLMYEENLALALALKKQSGSQILFGGPHVSLYPEKALQDGIDFVFRGEYENSVLSFFQQKKYQGDLKIFDQEKAVDFKTMPWPEDDDVSRMQYGIPGEPSSDYKEIQMYATRGCRGACTFCVVRHVYYKTPRHIARDPLDVVHEMFSLKRKYPELEGFFFDEEDHFDNRNFLIHFCNELIRRHNVLKIEGLGRMGGVHLDLLPLLKKAGYYKIRIGVESLHPDIQKAIRKRIPIASFEHFLLACKQNQLDVYTTFQVGLPGSTREKDLFTLSHLKKYLKQDLIKNLQVSIYTPFPGTPGFIEAKPYLTSQNFFDFNGGEQSVVNWPDYHSRDIQRTYREFLTVRDHIQLFARLRSKQAGSWLWDKFRKHSLPSLASKITRRLAREFDYAFKAFRT
jgi:radical SAM superfamily enzyme YgiQ (UPF0313 family)